MAANNDIQTMAGCARGCVPCRGIACERHSATGFVATGSAGLDDVVQETVDAVSGATWGTRNMIMENLFHQDMAHHGEAMPSYRPPGE